MAKFTHIHLSITTFSNGRHHVYLFEDVNGKRNVTNLWSQDDITPYLHKMWELVRLGGKYTFETNPYLNTLVTREVTLWEF